MQGWFESMVFRAASILQDPNGDPEKYRATINTPTSEFVFVVVKLGDLEGAVKAARSLVEEGFQAITLCPGFSHEEVARIQQAVGRNVTVNVARADVAGTMIAAQTLLREGWFPERKP